MPWLTEHGTILALLVTLVLAIKAFISHRTSYWKMRNVQFVPSNVLTAINRQFLKKDHLSKGTAEIYKSHSGPYVGFYEFTRPTIMIKDIDILNNILIKNFDHFINRAEFEISEKDRIGKNLMFFTTGEKWKDVRTAVSPTFTSKKIKIMSKLMLQTSECLKKILSEKAESGREFNIGELVLQTTTDVIAASVFGLQSKCLEGNKSFSDRLQKIMRKLQQNLFIFLLLPWLGKILGSRFLNNEQSDYLVNVVETAVKKRKEQNVSADDFIQHLIDLTETENDLHEDVNEDVDAKLDHKVNTKEGKSIYLNMQCYT